MDVMEMIKVLSETGGVSGNEQDVVAKTGELLRPYVDEIKQDKMGNLIALKKGDSAEKSRTVILFAAHVDEIGLMVTRIDDKGFVRFATIGGFDPRTLYGQQVVVRGKKPLTGVIGPRPPHLLTAEEIKKELDIEKMYIDLALTAAECRSYVKVGDFVTISRECRELAGTGCLAGKAMDNRAGIAALICCARELYNFKHSADLFLVATAQEEVGVRGILTAAYSLSPHIGIAVDVCHGDMPSVSQKDTLELGKGPALATGPNVHPVLEKKLKDLAGKYNLPYQLDPFPGPTPTDARGIQVSREGVPSALVSVPLRYMHTSVEVINTEDVRTAGLLLAHFTRDVHHDFLEELRCI